MRAKYSWEFYKARDGIRVRIRHRNGEVLFKSAQGYANRKDAEKVVDNLLVGMRMYDYDRVDAKHGRTTTKNPNPEPSDDVPV